jgi:CMP-2-keto-3-deoxyoctulosonic acid synthetase
VVKVELDDEGFALYFTRRDLPPRRPGGERLRHVGVYGFDRATLFDFAAWPPAEDECEERLEQLRALAHGVRIRVFRCARAGAGVDTPEQLEALERRGPTQ